MRYFGHNARAGRDGKEKSGTVKSCVACLPPANIPSRPFPVLYVLVK
jgi:hypothetical protein